MTALEFLEQAGILKKQLDAKNVELDSVKELSLSISSCNFDRISNTNRSIDPPYVKYTDKLYDMEKAIQADSIRLSDLRYKIGMEIDRVEVLNERLVLRYKYLMFMEWNEIAAKMKYSKRWVQKLHDQAVESFTDKWAENTKLENWTR